MNFSAKIEMYHVLPLRCVVNEPKMVEFRIRKYIVKSTMRIVSIHIVSFLNQETPAERLGGSVTRVLASNFAVGCMESIVWVFPGAIRNTIVSRLKKH